MSPSTPLHRFKQPDGSRYPDTRPDGLVRQDQLLEMLGIAKTTLINWRSLGWITPERKEGHCVLYRVPTPERIEDIRQLSKQRVAEAASRGRETQMAANHHIDRAAKGRAVKTEQAQERQAEGLLNKRQLAQRLATHHETLNRWIEMGLIAPARVSESGKWVWFESPDEATLEKIAKVRGRVVPARAAAGRANAHHLVTGDAIAKRQASRVSNRRGARPENCLTRSEAAEALGMITHTFNKHVQKGWISESQAGWIHQDDLDQYKAKLSRAKASVSVSPPKNVVYAPKTKTVRPFAKKATPKIIEASPKPAPVKDGFITYDLGVSEGRTDARFQTVLGFNLLFHPDRGFRAAVVNEKPEGGWRYHERHGLNGWGQWQVRGQKPVTGEIVL